MRVYILMLYIHIIFLDLISHLGLYWGLSKRWGIDSYIWGYTGVYQSVGGEIVTQLYYIWSYTGVYQSVRGEIVTQYDIGAILGSIKALGER